MTTTAGARGPYAKTVAVRERILEAARAIFAETGYRATTMKAVAERSAISQRGLAHHFPSKEDLLAAVLAENDSTVAKKIPEGSGAPALRRMVDVAAADAKEPGLIELYAILSAEAVAADHPAHAYYGRRYETFRTYVQEQFDTARDAGLLTSDLDSATLAVQFTGLLDGLQVQWLYDRDIDLSDALHRFLDQHLSPRPRASAGGTGL